MDSVYRNCILNIAASCADNVQSGFFRTRDYGTICPCIITLKSSLRDSTDIACHSPLLVQDYAMSPPPQSLENLIQRHPLDKRAWVLQERLLASRTLHFSDQQLFWECNEVLLAFESVPEGIPEDWNKQMRKPVFSMVAKEGEDQRIIWLDILEDYTRRDLTMAEDKLPAIGAVAKLIQSRFDDKYLAGFFTTQLPRGFLWFRIQRQVSSSNEIQNNTRARRYTEGSYRAPTWSWACIDGPVSFYFCYPDITMHSVFAPKLRDIVGSGQFCDPC
jgi:hypothetical protein